MIRLAVFDPLDRAKELFRLLCDTSVREFKIESFQPVHAEFLPLGLGGSPRQTLPGFSVVGALGDVGAGFGFLALR